MYITKILMINRYLDVLQVISFLNALINISFLNDELNENLHFQVIFCKCYHVLNAFFATPLITF